MPMICKMVDFYKNLNQLENIQKQLKKNTNNDRKKKYFYTKASFALIKVNKNKKYKISSYNLNFFRYFLWIAGKIADFQPPISILI